MDKILEKINKMRKERGWSINKLAMEAELTQSTVAHMFSRGTRPSLSTLEKICKAFGITMAEFFTEENEVEYLQIDEKAIIVKYRKMSSHNKESVKAVIDALSKRN